MGVRLDPQEDGVGLHIDDFLLNACGRLANVHFQSSPWNQARGSTDPPPYLCWFLEVLSRRLKEEVEGGHLVLYKAGGIMVESHLAYADR